MKNLQRPSPILRGHSKLSVHSMFLTFQGEGPFAGERALFIRLAGCNLQCPLCDTEYTSTKPEMSPSAILARAKAMSKPRHGYSRKPLIVITGGEPFRQDISGLCNILLAERFRVQVETNGMVEPVAGDYLDHHKFHVVVSPKTHKLATRWKTHPDRVTAYKYVVRAGELHPEDFFPTKALDHPLPKGQTIARPPANYRGPVYFNPVDEHADSADNAANRVATLVAVEHIDTYHRVLGLQIHKEYDLA